MADIQHMLRDTVQATMGLALVGASIYLAVVGRLPMEFFCTCVGVALGFYMAERKNGTERAAELEKEKVRQGWQQSTR